MVHPARESSSVGASGAQTGRTVAISPDDGTIIDLRNRWLAALLAWCVPGLGHFYQGRTHKGGLFLGAILGMFLAGLWLGGGKVVYAAWRPEPRWAYLCQAGAGLVYDSVPETEYEETVNKATALFRAVDFAEKGLES